MVKYLVMMGIRVACFAAMVLVTPYGWYTWLFAVGAVVLPYIAVVIANVGQSGRAASAERPDQRAHDAAAQRPGSPPVIRLTENDPGGRSE